MVFLLACIYQSISISIFPKLLLIIISIDILPPNRLSNWNILKSNLSWKPPRHAVFFLHLLIYSFHFLPISPNFVSKLLHLPPALGCSGCTLIRSQAAPVTPVTRPVRRRAPRWAPGRPARAGHVDLGWMYNLQVIYTYVYIYIYTSIISTCYGYTIYSWWFGIILIWYGIIWQYYHFH